MSKTVVRSLIIKWDFQLTDGSVNKIDNAIKNLKETAQHAGAKINEVTKNFQKFRNAKQPVDSAKNSVQSLRREVDNLNRSTSRAFITWQKFTSLSGRVGSGYERFQRGVSARRLALPPGTGAGTYIAPDAHPRPNFTLGAGAVNERLFNRSRRLALPPGTGAGTYINPDARPRPDFTLGEGEILERLRRARAQREGQGPRPHNDYRNRYDYTGSRYTGSGAMSVPMSPFIPTQRHTTRAEKLFQSFEKFGGILDKTINPTGDRAFAIAKQFRYVAMAGAAVTAAFYGMQRAVITAGKAIWGNIVSPAMDNVQIEAGSRAMFRNMYGNLDQANELLHAIRQYSINTAGIDFKGALTGVRQLVAMGVPIQDALQVFQDIAPVAMATGTDISRISYNLGQVVARGFMPGTELRDFARQGVPILQELSKMLTERTGKVVTEADISEMVSRRELSAQMVLDVFRRMAGPGGRFEGVQHARTQTGKGQLERMQQTWQDILTDVGKFEDTGLANVFNLITEFMEKNRDSLVQVGRLAWQSFNQMLVGLVDFVIMMIDNMPMLLFILDIFTGALHALTKVAQLLLSPFSALFKLLMGFGAPTASGKAWTPMLATQFGDISKIVQAGYASQTQSAPVVYMDAKIDTKIDVNGASSEDIATQVANGVKRGAEEASKKLQETATSLVTDRFGRVIY